MKNVFLVILSFIFALLPAQAKNIQGVWHNDLKTLFSKNSAIIYAINIRTFSAKDKNNNEIIDAGEECGNFLSAIDELDNLVKAGINTLHVLPITPVGKIKAFGTAGSLYAPVNLNEINPQLVSSKSSLSGMEQAEKFIKECHKRNLRVILDLPGCGSYDMYVEHPEYFALDEKQNTIIPFDWTDVRLFDCGTADKPNEDLLELHKKFIDMAIALNADGIRADTAWIKPAYFWRELISYAHKKAPDLLFFAEASGLWIEPVSQNIPRTALYELLTSGFDGCLGNYFDFKNWKTSKDLISTVKADLKLFSEFKTGKSAVGSFSTHDEISPVLIHGAKFSKMIIWLNTTLPLNSYYIDGFSTGDTYNYSWANKCAQNSQTDDDYYFVHNGKMDIFNFSRKPQGDDYSIYEEFVLANKFKNYYASDLCNAKFVPLKCSNPKVFAYARVTNNSSIIVFGNLDFNNPLNVTIKIPKFKPDKKIVNLRVHQDIANDYSKNKIKTTLDAGSIQVLLIRNFTF